jgi:SAM-dependent methyltransferase
MDSRLAREQQFHDERFGGGDVARQEQVEKFYTIARHSNSFYRELVLPLCPEADVLEYGCGTGSSAFLWANQGARVTGIDLSGAGVKQAAVQARSSGLAATFQVMNGESLGFAANRFDVVTGKGIIHHLRLEIAYRELVRVLKPAGQAIFVEPLGHNPLINWYRHRTPALRTTDEHPLLMADIELAGRFFGQVQVEYFHLLTLVAVPLRRTPLFNGLLNGLYALDRAAMWLLPASRRYAWIAVIRLQQPIKTAGGD